MSGFLALYLSGSIDERAFFLFGILIIIALPTLALIVLGDYLWKWFKNKKASKKPPL